MKTQILLTTLILSAFFSFGQLKPQIGVYTEGSWFLPKNIIPNIKTKDRSFSVGGGFLFLFRKANFPNQHFLH